MEVHALGRLAATSLRSREAPLASAEAQRGLLDALPLPRFDDTLRARGCDPLRRTTLRTVQVNLGKLCNLSCRHCHVDAGPDRTDAVLGDAVLDAILDALPRCSALTLDITGGAPELHPRFRELVDVGHRAGLHVMDRCNLTVLLLPSQRGLVPWLAEREVEIVASLPHPRAPQTDQQRGEGVWERSVEALRLLNEAGYGLGDPRRRLTLVSNPGGAWLVGNQSATERDWRAQLARTVGVRFDRLFLLQNLPISRYLEWLHGEGRLLDYVARLAEAFNPAATAGLMCRDTLSIGWDGRVFDCDFNQMLDLGAATQPPAEGPWDLDALAAPGAAIRTARHCFGCTAGAGSSCGGATAEG